MSVASDAAAEAVAGVMGDLFPETATAAPVQGEQPAPTVPEVTQEREPSTFPEADTSGLDFLDDEPEPEQDNPFADDDDWNMEVFETPETETDEYVDPQVAKIIAQNKKLQAQIQHERNLRKQAKEKDWRSEAGRRFPFCQPETLSGDSRRAVLREAKKQDDRIRSVVKPHLDALMQARGAVLDEATAEARVRAEQAWGKPTAGPNQAMLEAVQLQETDQNRHDRSKYGSVYESVLARFKKGYEI